MQNEILSQLASRKSVRVFTDREIGEEARLAILTAASDAPTAGNQQLYTVIDVRDQEKKDRLAKSCDDQPFIAEAKLVLVFCADLLKWHAAFRAAGADPRPAGVGDLLLATCDAMAAAQNAVTAAWSLGIGSCYIGDILENRAVQKEILSLPDRVVPVAMLVFGYPAQQQLERKKPARTDLRHLVHEDQYHTLSDEEALDLTRYHFGAGDIREHLKAFCERKYNSGFAREMTRSVSEYLTEFDRG